MIIKGLSNIKKHADEEYETNLINWYSRNGVRRPRRRPTDDGGEWVEFDDEISGGRGLAHLYFDVPN